MLDLFIEKIKINNPSGRFYSFTYVRSVSMEFSRYYSKEILNVI
jgi:hypothetical protein